ncbi:hypothetical protein [Arthrobacter woluwensis]|uniref:hypothetical protein n=1 Tax=Arthrobacter woluwensis TaxID=156980 RepID=UPI001AAEBB3C|nr:hypothetical protein [Arthrobacter woluwensis]QTF71768.1 hypothetical protein G8758_06945 [Arthrobacter woluwensis]
MSITLEQYMQKNTGKYLFIPGYGSAECVAEFWTFNRECGNGEAYSAPGAFNLWETVNGEAYIWEDYERIPASGPFLPGDQLIYSGKTGPLANGGSGHVCMFLRDNRNGTFQTLSQNPGPLLEQPITKAGLVGALRLKSLKAGQVGNLLLPASATSWNVYPMGKAPVVGNQVGKLAPSKFGGLRYEIKGWTMPNVAIIDTRDFGRVQIYVAASTGAVIS